jgi:hypothetical protein
MNVQRDTVEETIGYGTMASAFNLEEQRGLDERAHLDHGRGRRIVPNTPPCACPTSCHRLVSVTYMRVLTTCSSSAPACCSASCMRRSASRVCPPMSLPPTARPSGAAAVVPAT